MKRLLLFVSLFIVFAAVTAIAQDKVEAPAACEKCGMDRTMFGYSRMLITYENGDSVGTCSLHCAATELREHPDKKVKSLQVADCKSRVLIDAKRAAWVIGGEKSGVMTELPKWAFAKKEDAEAFVKKYGGRLGEFKEAMALAEKEHE